MKFTKNCLMLALLLAVPFAARAQNFQSESFIAGSSQQATSIGGSGLQVNVGVPVLYGSTNLIYSSGFVQTNSATYPYVSGYSPVWHTNSAGIQDCGLWANRDGTAPNATVSAWISAPSGDTNTLTFNFAIVPNGNVASTAAQNLWSFSVQKDNATDTIVTTNLPTALLNGNAGLRLLSIVPSGVSQGTNYVISGLRLNGYHPVQ